MSAFFSVTLTLFFVIDALGQIPTYLDLLKPFDAKKQKKIAIRELLIALVIMLVFHYFGQGLLTLLHVSKTTVQVAGGIILFLISIRLIFSDEERTKWKEQEPFIVPIATPIIAGPSVLAAIMIFAQNNPSDFVICGAVILAWFLSATLFLFAKPIHKIVKDQGLNAAQRLMGLIVALIAVQLFLEGIIGLLQR